MHNYCLTQLEVMAFNLLPVAVMCNFERKGSHPIMFMKQHLWTLARLTS